MEVVWCDVSGISLRRVCC